MAGVRSGGDNPGALEALREAAAGGDAHAQARLARMYLQGVGVDRDYKLALAWCRKSAEQGHGDAQARLGRMHEKGLGVDADVRAALDWYQRAVEQGSALGQIFLGDLYLAGSGVDQSSRKALASYLKAALQEKDPESAVLARLRLGAVYCQGRGVEKDLRKGFAYYLQAARLGDAEAQVCVGAMYRDGAGVKRDHKKALEWFQKTARRNRPQAESAMGDIYRDGMVVERNIPQAIHWYKKAAAKGDKYAKSELLKLRQGECAPPPARQPEAARPQVRKEVPRKASRRSVPVQAGRTKRVLGARARLFQLSAIVLGGLSLLAVLLRSGKGPEMTPLSLGPAALDLASLPRPAPQSLPGAVPWPSPEILKRIRLGKAPRQPGVQVVVPAQAPDRATTESKPAAPRFRREYRVLDEGAITGMLAARNLFDARRNPAGGGVHRYEALNAAGPRLIIDRATDLLWLPLRNPVRMSLDKTRQWIASLNRIGFGGIRSWRLPTVEEAASLLQRSEGGGGIFLDGIFGRDIKATWTGDSLAESDSWIVDFQGGVVKAAKNKSRLVTLMVSSDSIPFDQ